jgi:hypothetical protein
MGRLHSRAKNGAYQRGVLIKVDVKEGQVGDGM